MRALAIIVAGLWLVPEVAEACSPWPEQVDAVVPTGGTHPANAAMIIRGHQLRPELLVATIDGQAAQVVVDEELSLAEEIFEGNFRTLALRVEPAPMPGQTVHLSGQPCEMFDAPLCEPIDVTFTATEPDQTPPGEIGVVSYDLVRLTDFEENSCGERGSWIEVELSLAPDIGADEALVMYDLTATHAQLDIAVSSRGHAEDLGESMRRSVEVFKVGEDFPIEGWCVAIRTVDAAGNESASAASCSPCMWVTREPNTLFGDEMWNPVPGGACEGGAAESSTGAPGSTGEESPTSEASPTSGASSVGETSSSGGGAEESPGPDKGCGCRSAPVGDVAPFIVTLGLLARRRRRI